ncbi:Protein of unknown function [Bacillus wiedmannii]|uniref:Uncharacterized protein n=1 Tax=Bacillus wiedmannii TaxID=1890302 RepID=A0A1C3ZKF0_9BACI|nr:Protein of unknown function [Bacillus wiedmannii]
MRQLQVLRV